jgi:hypothetical protein
MRTWTIVAVSLVGFGFALWLARGDDAPKSPTTIATAAPAAVAQPFPRYGTGGNAAFAGAPAAADGKEPPPKLDPRSDKFRNRLDEQIPSRLYGLASHCYKGGLQRDQRLDLTYRIHVADGNVRIDEVRTSESTLNDPSLERCIHDTIIAAKWRDEQLPDLEEDDDLMMRVGGFTSYLANADDESPSSSAQN